MRFKEVVEISLGRAPFRLNKAVLLALVVADPQLTLTRKDSVERAPVAFCTSILERE